MILGYDKWKTTPQDEQEPVAECTSCRFPLYPLEEVIIYSGEIYCCNECLIAGLKKSMEITVRELEEEEMF